MKLLALDTSSVACSVAVQVGNQVYSKHEEKPREHTRLLMPMIRSLLAKAEIEMSDLDGIVLGNGPGSFIGMRIAASVAQGLAFGANLKIAPVSSMAAIAADVSSRGAATVAVAQDAHMQEVYLGLYDVNDGAVVDRVPERLQRCEAIAELADTDNCIAAGYGWQRFPALLEANRTHLKVVSDVLYPHAACLLALGEKTFQRGDSITPGDVVPAYLRQKVAAENPQRKFR